MPEPADERREREQRVAENQAIFRRANQALHRRYRELATDELAPFLCECGDAECTRIVRLGLDEYEGIRGRPGHFAIVPGHAILEAERVVAENERYQVVEKPPPGDETTNPP